MMISVKIKYSMGIEDLTGGNHETFSFQGSTMEELIIHLVKMHPSLKVCFEEKEGMMEPAPGICLLVNGKEITWLQKMHTPLCDGDEITFLRFVSGG